MAHDPCTVAFQVPNPFCRRYRFPNGKPLPSWSSRPALLTIWHRDPETDFTENSCDWSGRRGLRSRWWHPRWHVHHWRIQWNVVQDVWRWLFKRCTWCGGRYRWRTGVLAMHWPSRATFHPKCEREFSRRQEEHYRAKLEREAAEFADGIALSMIAEAMESDEGGETLH